VPTGAPAVQVISAFTVQKTWDAMFANGARIFADH